MCHAVSVTKIVGTRKLAKYSWRVRIDRSKTVYRIRFLFINRRCIEKPLTKPGLIHKKSRLPHRGTLLFIGQARLELATPSPPDSYANHLRYCPVAVFR